MKADATDGDPSFDRYARMVRRYLDVPIALVSIVEATRQVFPGASGLAEPLATRRETPLSYSFCKHVVRDEAPLIVTDARLDPRVSDNPSITELDLVAYAGWPLIDEDGTTIGSLCAIDHEPRSWTREDLDALADLADACSAELMYRNRQREAEQQAEHAREMSQRSQVLLALSEGLSVTQTLDDVALAVERVAKEQLGCLHAGIWLRSPASPSTGEQDTLRHIFDPTSDWPSVRRNARLPVDESNPIGEAATLGRPVFYLDREEQNRRFPDLVGPDQVGEGRALMPLALSGRVFGTLLLLWPGPREVSAEHRVTLTALASYVSQAVQRALLLKERIDASVTLQSAMLTRLPDVEGLELGAGYRPAGAQDRVGGDWYDVVVSSGGWVHLMIGDVAGHDIAAAAVMGELRSMLRAFVWDHEDLPAATITRLDRAMESFGITRFASLVKMRLEPADEKGDRLVRWTNAGHFAPLLLRRDGTTELLDDGLDPDVVLGVAPELERHDQHQTLAAGSTLLLYTDGLVERGAEDIDAGLRRLRASAVRHRHLPVDKLVEEILDELIGPHPDDDVAALAVRFG